MNGDPCMGSVFSIHLWPVQLGNMEHTYHVCTCTAMYMCVGVFADTLQVPMQPTGLSGRPLNPSFLLMARKRYACRDTHTHTRIHMYTWINNLDGNHNIHTARDLSASIPAVREFSDISLWLYLCCFGSKNIIFDFKCHTAQCHSIS